MRSYKTYIAGRVTGLPREEAKRNFARGERLLLVNTFDVVNPLALVPEEATPKEAMAICLPALLKCEAILLLDDYKFSEGAQLEEATARYCNMQIFYEDDLN